ncbi:MAG: hypothetical protein N2255_06800, partial [Kiritimatiellae bacterium]|nr:hypothetical protein [Kiritimatiellia bacterium]
MTNPIWLGVGGFVLLWGAMSPTVLQPSFAKKPVAVLQGDSVRIEFAVDRATDVAVFVENREGEIVRHLAAGCLGSNAPAPLKPNSLVQSLIWDGKDDDGNTVWRTANRPEPLFRVRVGLGLTPAYAGLAFTTNSGPNHIGPVWGMAAGEDGRLYVMDDHSGWLYWPAKALHVFRRDGSYEKTIKPFPSHLAPDRLKGTGAFINQRGYLNPLIHRPLGMTFYAFEDEPAAQMAVSKTGRIYLAVVSAQTPPPGNPTYRGVAAHIAALGTDGSISEPYAGPALGRDIAVSYTHL